MVVKVVLACFALVSAGSALVLQGEEKLDSDIDAAANESRLGNNWLPMSCLRVAAIGSWYGQPMHRYANGACNSNYAFHPENMIYNCPQSSFGYGTGWIGPDCKLNNGVTSNSLGNTGGCGGTAKTNAEWFVFDLGFTRYIASVKFKPSYTTWSSHYACPTYRVLTSDSAPASGTFVAQASVGYTTIVDQSNAVDTSQEYTHSMGVSARYIMFDCVTSTVHSGGLDNFDVKVDGDTSPCDLTAPLPTPPPTPPTPAGGAAAVGDPHLQNVHGERFDLMKPGKHVLINIPRGVGAVKSLLRVQADARQLGVQCADMYFQEVNVTGSWADAKQAGGYRYSVSQGDAKVPEWLAFGKVGLKVVHGRADSGLSYLNVYVKHLGRAGFPVGGLLGEDDHEDVITPEEKCVKSLSLISSAEGGQTAPSLLSVAEASLA